MKKIELLKRNIEQSNLSKKDKKKLISILSEENPDKVKFVKTFLAICKVGKVCLKLFDVDIGDIF
jgi:hypothetical protein